MDKCECGNPVADVQTDQCQECIVAEYDAIYWEDISQLVSNGAPSVVDEVDYPF